MKELVEKMARAMCGSKAWPVVFQSGAAQELSRAALRAITDAGYAVVPVEPSWGMKIAGRDAILAEDGSLDLSSDDAFACYRAMLAAAPKMEG